MKDTPSVRLERSALRTPRRILPVLPFRQSRCILPVGKVPCIARQAVRQRVSRASRFTQKPIDSSFSLAGPAWLAEAVATGSRTKTVFIYKSVYFTSVEVRSRTRIEDSSCSLAGLGSGNSRRPAGVCSRAQVEGVQQWQTYQCR
jgi:hypothetical protein